MLDARNRTEPSPTATIDDAVVATARGMPTRRARTDGGAVPLPAGSV